MGYHTCGGTVYKPCGFDLTFLNDGTLTTYEKLCYMIELFREALGGLDGIDEALALKEDKINLTNVRLLSETGDFTGTWAGETKVEYTAFLQSFIQALIDNLQTQVDDLAIEDQRIESKFDGEVTRIDAEISALDVKYGDEIIRVDAELALKENSIDITNLRLLSPTGNFTGTWEGTTYADFQAQITNAETLYQNVIDLINANPNVGITVRDGGFLASAVVPTFEDFGLVADPPTLELDYGLVIYPCNCTI